jgi:hypothetical protein
MINQFVDHFKTKEYGFNFFPILGLILAGLLASGFRILFFSVLNLIRGSSSVGFNYTGSIYFTLFFAFVLVFLCHLIKRDILLPIVFSIAYLISNTASKWIYYTTGGFPQELMESLPLARYLFDLEGIIYALLWAAALSTAFILLFRAFKRLDYTLFCGFPVVWVLTLIFNVIRRGSFFDLWQIGELVEAALSGFLFFLGYKLYMRGKGLQVEGEEIRPTGEDTAPRTDFLSIKKYFGAILVITIIDLVVFAFMLPVINLSFEYSRRGRGSAELSGLMEGWLFPVMMLLGVIILIVSVVIYLRIIYRMWTAVQDGHASTTPGKAVGLLFVPFFNLYWIFKVNLGFAQDYNALVDRHGLTIPKLPVGLFLTLCIAAVLDGLLFSLFSINPSIPIVIAFIHVALLLAVVYLTCQAVNRIPPEIYPKIILRMR